jgi:hypothetical protein
MSEHSEDNPSLSASESKPTNFRGFLFSRTTKACFMVAGKTKNSGEAAWVLMKY